MDKQAPFTRIKAPKYKIGRYVLNEYELRCLMAQVAQGLRAPISKPVTDHEGNVAYMREDGRFREHLAGLDISGNFTLDMIRSDRETGRTAAAVAKAGGTPKEDIFGTLGRISRPRIACHCGDPNCNNQHPDA